jgi:hypothetical protein
MEGNKSIKQTTSLSTWAAIFIALCSLGLSLYSGYEDRRYKRLSVRPEIQLSFYYTKGTGAGWTLWNSGLGPGRIKWCEVTVDGQPKKNWREVASSFRFTQGAKKINYLHSYPAANVLIKSGFSDKIFWFEDEALVEDVKQNRERVKIRICYCSLYDECWQTEDTVAGSVKSSCEELPPVPFGSYPVGPLSQ